MLAAAVRYAEGPNFVIDLEEGVAVCRVFKRPELDPAQLNDAAALLLSMGKKLALEEGVAGLVLDLRRTSGAVGPNAEQALAALGAAWEDTGQRIAFLVLDDSVLRMQLNRIAQSSTPRFGAVFVDRNEARSFVGALGSGPNTGISRMLERPTRSRLK